MGSYDPIAYTYDADVHCPGCALARFGADERGFIGIDPETGDSCTDGEDNAVGVISPWDEWQTFDGEHEALTCGSCGGVIDTYEPSS